MKKIISMIVLGLIVSMTAVLAYNGKYTPMDVDGVHSHGGDDQHIVMEGKFVEHVQKDKYVFQDQSGKTMTVEVDDDCGVVRLNVAVRAYGELDVKHGKVELEVDRIEAI